MKEYYQIKSKSFSYTVCFGYQHRDKPGKRVHVQEILYAH